MHAKVKAEIQAAAEFADASAFPDPTDILTDMYTSAVDGVK
jgi:TPP-dependent pyruvate/acetoin dehydrogenase alpha subunit